MSIQKLSSTLLLLLICSCLSGCSFILRNSIDDQINEHFPPVDYSKVKRNAVQRSTAELASMQQPAMLLNVPTSTLQEAFAIALTKIPDSAVRIISAKIIPEEQGIRFLADIEGQLEKPRGTFQATLDGWAMATIENHIATVQPVLRSAKLTGLKLEEWSCASSTVRNAVNFVLNRYINNVNGQIKPISETIDFTKIGLSEKPTKVEIAPGKWVTVPGVKLGPTAALIESDGLHVLAQIDVVSDSRRKELRPDDTLYTKYVEAFWRRAEAVRAGPNRAQPGLFFSNTILAELLRPGFPPIALADLQQVALSNVLESTKPMGAVAAGALISGPTLIENLTSVIQASITNNDRIQYGTPRVALDEQTVIVTIPAEGVIEHAHINFKGEVTAAGVIAPDRGQLYFRLALVGISLSSVEHTGGQIGLVPFVGSVNDLLTQLVPYLNGSLDNKPIDIPLPTMAPVPITQSGVNVTPKELKLSLPGRIIIIPRLNNQGLRAIVVATPQVTDTTTNSVLDLEIFKAQRLAALNKPGNNGGNFKSIMPQSPVTPEEVDTVFNTLWTSALPKFDHQSNVNIGAVLSLPWAVSMVNQTLVDNRIAITAPIDSGDAEFDSGHLRVAGWLQPNCTVNLTCKRGDCGRNADVCKRSGCDWDCRRCAWGACFDDPICKTGEAACNVREEASLAACNAAEEAKVAACNVAEEAKLAACNIERETQVLGCNIVNETIRAIRELDSIGSFSGKARAQGTASLANPEIRYNSATRTAQLSISAEAHVRADGRLSFTPADIGHLLVCPIQGVVDFGINGEVPQSRQTIEASLVASDADSEGKLPLDLQFNPITVSGQLTPAPVDALLGQNPNLFILCNPIAGVVGSIGNLGKISAYTSSDILGAIEKAIPGNQDDQFRALKTFTTGKVEETVKIPSMRVSIPVMKALVAGSVINLKPEWTDGHITYVQR